MPELEVNGDEPAEPLVFGGSVRRGKERGREELGLTLDENRSSSESKLA